MLKSIISGCLFILSSFLYAQEDTISVTPSNPEYDFLYRELFNFHSSSLFGSLNFEQTPKLYKQLNFDQPLVVDYNYSELNYPLQLSNSLPVFNPFISSLTITNQAHYKLNNRLTFGGNSFSASSIFDPVPLNPSIQEMGIRGASMFLQYKISDKVKIGGSISISNKQSPYFP